jgi:SPP1 family predicted phage head-tail adaptor
MAEEFAGRLREQIAILSSLVTADGYGGQTLTWSTLTTCAAAVTAEPEDRDTIAGRAGHLRRYRIDIRPRHDVRAGMRIDWRGHILDITAVPPVRPDAQSMTLLADEVPGL